MKMNSVDDKEEEFLVKHIISRFMKDQLSERKGDQLENNNSFIYLEKSTLNMLMILLMNTGQKSYGGVSEDSRVKVLEEIDQVIVDSKKEFEEILTLLKASNFI